MRTREMIAQARIDGRRAGENAASWVFDGNSKDEEYRAILRGIMDGDPAIYDMLRVPDLSGEWADSPTPQTLAEDYGIDDERDPNGSILDAVCTAWENGASDAFYATVEGIARVHLAG